MKLLFWNKFNLFPRFHTWLILSYCLFIFFLSFGRFNSVVTLNKSKFIGLRADYLAHALLFTPWMLLACWGWGEKTSRKIFLTAVAAGVALAALSESVQLFVPKRTFNIIDFIANILGVAIGAVLVGIDWKKIRCNH